MQIVERNTIMLPRHDTLNITIPLSFCTKKYKKLQLFIFSRFSREKIELILDSDVCYRICYSITRARTVHDPVASFCWRAAIAIDSSPPKAKSRINRYVSWYARVSSLSSIRNNVRYLLL